MIAAKGVGLISDIEEEINQVVNITTKYEPRQQYTEVYNEYAEIYYDTINDLKNTYNKLDNINVNINK